METKSRKVATRYARAMYGYIGSGPDTQQVVEELREFMTNVDENLDLKVAIASQKFSTVQKSQIVGDVASVLKLADNTKKCLRLLVESSRIFEAKTVAQVLEELVLEASSSAAIAVESSTNLSDVEKKSLENKFSEILGKKIFATYQMNESLLGGVRVSVQGKIFDGTVTGWLKNFESDFTERTDVTCN